MTVAKYIQIKKDGVYDIEPENIKTSEPHVIFLGGLLHLNNLGLTKGFANLVHSLFPNEMSTLPIISCVFNLNANFGDMAAQMHQVEKDNSSTKEAIQLVEDLILPDSVCKRALVSSAAREFLEKRFQGIKFIGYSYRTSLIQQIELYTYEKLRRYNLPTDVMQHLRAINIGPVTTPKLRISADKFYRSDRKTFNGELGDVTFEHSMAQIFVYKSTDKVMQDVIGRSLIDENLQTKPYDVFGIKHLQFVCENAGDEMLRRFGVGKFPRGTPDPRLQYVFDSEAHDLRIYTSTLRAEQTEKGIFCTYPSSNLGIVIREAIEAMIEGKDFSNLRTISSLQEYPNNAPYDLEKLADEFNNLINGYRTTDFSQSISYLRENAAKVLRRAVNPLQRN